MPFERISVLMSGMGSSGEDEAIFLKAGCYSRFLEKA